MCVRAYWCDVHKEMWEPGCVYLIPLRYGMKTEVSDLAVWGMVAQMAASMS